MAKTPVSMKIDGYKDREVLKVTYEFAERRNTRPDGMDGRTQPAKERKYRVLGDQNWQGYEVHQIYQRLLRRLRREVGRQGGSLRGDSDYL